MSTTPRTTSARDEAIARLRAEVRGANVDLWRLGLARFTFGNASAVDRDVGIVVIKPSGVPYDELRAEDCVAVNLADGAIVDGTMRPSSDLPTHLVLYRAFANVGGIVHTHSHYATVWAQARRDIPCFGTTHADYFHGPIPVTDSLSHGDIAGEYEANTGLAIVRRLGDMDPLRMPAALVAGHASFCWARDVRRAVQTAAVLEDVARMAFDTQVLHAAAEPISSELLDKHFLRKHGPKAYYGQR